MEVVLFDMDRRGERRDDGVSDGEMDDILSAIGLHLMWAVLAEIDLESELSAIIIVVAIAM